jgi:exportin-1
MRAVKREILKLFSLAILSVPEKELASFRCQYIPKILESILLDYKNNEPQAREAEVLSMTASVFEQFKEGESGMFVKPVVDSVFEVTLEMINKDFSEYPEHRAAFFGLLQALTSHCFLSLIALDTRMFKLYYDSIVWAFKHNHRDISDKGLGICSTLLESIDNVDPRHAQAFYSQYYIPLLQDLLYVLTDSDHYSSIPHPLLIP